MNNNKNNNAKTLVLAIIAVVAIAVAAAGGTYAWWSWSSNQANANENTAINFSMSDPSDMLTMSIVGNNINTKTLAPSSVCYGEGYTLASYVTVTTKNLSTVDAKTTFVLSASLTPVSGRTFQTGDTAHLHWAIKEVTSANKANYAVGNCNGGTNSTTFNTGTFASVGTSATNISTTISYDVAAGTSSDVKYYQLYVWLDSGYNFTNTGSGSVTDPMQDATVMLTFATTSKIEQKTS